MDSPRTDVRSVVQDGANKDHDGEKVIPVQDDQPRGQERGDGDNEHEAGDVARVVGDPAREIGATEEQVRQQHVEEAETPAPGAFEEGGGEDDQADGAQPQPEIKQFGEFGMNFRIQEKGEVEPGDDGQQGCGPLQSPCLLVQVLHVFFAVGGSFRVALDEISYLFEQPRDHGYRSGQRFFIPIEEGAILLAY